MYYICVYIIIFFYTNYFIMDNNDEEHLNNICNNILDIFTKNKKNITIDEQINENKHIELVNHLNNEIDEKSNETHIENNNNNSDNNCDNDSDNNSDNDSDNDSENDSNNDSENDSYDDNNNNKNINNDDNTDIDTNYEKKDYEIPDELLGQNIIGIDLGTTNTCVSIWRNGHAEIIPDEFGNKIMPSYVAYTNKNRYIGHDAKRQKDINIKNVFYEVKRLIGRKYDDKFVKREKCLLSYDIIQNQENNGILLKPEIRDGKILTPEEISASILSKVKQIASDYLKQKISKCVITIPAHFNDGQRQATKDAAKIAGLECVRIINEPTSAALAYGLLERTQTQKCKSKNIIVYDFGGGTLDVSLLNIENGIFSVLGSTGNMRLGGSDFDSCLIEFCIRKFANFNKEFKLEELSALSLQKLRTSCENAKQLLSVVLETHIAVKDFYNGKDLCYKITREEFEMLCRDLFLLCMKPINDILKMCSITEEQINEIILVGGMTRMPKIRELLQIKLGKTPNCTINPDEAVAVGAAIQGYLLSHPDNPFSESITLLDSTSLSLGVETIGGLMNTVIKRGETIPVSRKRIYSTDKDYVKCVKIKVYEGERRLTKDNFFVGEFILKGISPQLRGIPEIEVMFSIDVNGIITVTATNKKNNTKSSMTITSNKGRLSQEQINNLIEESRDLEIRDELEKRKKWLHYEIDDLCSNILLNLKNKSIKISDYDKEIIKDDVNKITKWLSEKTFDEREDEEYENIIANIKKKYGVLIIKNNIDNNSENIKSYDDDNVSATTIYGDDDKNISNVMIKLEEDIMGLNGMSNIEKEELKELRKCINELCHSVLNITANDNINLSQEHINELKDYVDDTLLWIHIHDKITKQEYLNKIDEINSNCDKIFNYYKENDKQIFNQNVQNDPKYNLEQLCFALKIMIEDNVLNVRPGLSNDIQLLSEQVENNINWLFEDNDINDEFYLECNSKINYLNKLCCDLQNKMQGININEKVDIFGNDRIILDTEDEHKQDTNENDKKGTSVISILQKKKQIEMEKLINRE